MFRLASVDVCESAMYKIMFIITGRQVGCKTQLDAYP